MDASSAECLRQLGRFSECLAILAAPELAHRPDAAAVRSLGEKGVERISIVAVAA